MNIKIMKRNFIIWIAKVIWPLSRASLIILLGYVILYPLLEMITKSFMPVEQYSDPSVIWIPKSLTLTNIKAAAIVLDYGKGIYNSCVLSIGCAVLQVIFCALIAYGFARFRFPGNKVLFALVILTIVVPTQILYIPLMVQYRFFDFFGISHLIALFTGKPYTEYTINLINSNLSFFLPSIFGVGVRSGLFIYVYRQFFRNMPKELEEAAKIDGCGPFRTFWKIMVPNVKSAGLTVFLFSIVWHWNETMMSGSFFSGDKLPLAVKVQRITEAMVTSVVEAGFYDAIGRNTVTSKAVTYTSLFLFILPPFVLYIFAQRFFVEGIESSGIKG